MKRTIKAPICCVRINQKATSLPCRFCLASELFNANRGQNQLTQLGTFSSKSVIIDKYSHPNAAIRLNFDDFVIDF